MRHHDEAVVVRHCLDEAVEQLLVRRPAAACYDAFPVADKLFDIGETLCLLGNLVNAVETCVACYCQVVDAHLVKKVGCFGVLREEKLHFAEMISEPAAPRLEEILIRAKHRGDVKQRYMSVFQYFNVIKPELVFHEDSGFKLEILNKLTCIFNGVERHISHHIGQRAVLFYLISRRGEEGEKELILRILIA